jgi:hypothetical protein
MDKVDWMDMYIEVQAAWITSILLLYIQCICTPT